MELIIGPMFSGKSTELIRRCKRLRSIGLTVLVINHALDQRDGSDVVTHDGQRLKAMSCSSIDLNLLKGFDVIAIDEAQFFKSLPLNDILKKHRLIVACLSGDSNQQPWDGIGQLISHSDEITHLRAICICQRAAAFTKKRNQSSRIDIGSSDKYYSVCRRCLKH